MYLRITVNVIEISKKNKNSGESRVTWEYGEPDGQLLDLSRNLHEILSNVYNYAW